MSKGFACVLSFALGAAVGVFATRKYFDAKYQQIADDEIASVKEVFSKRSEAKEENKEQVEVSTKTVNDILEKEQYSSKSVYESEQINFSGQKEIRPEDKIYVISPEEFGELEDYDKISLTYYSDGVLADDMDNVIEDIEDVVGDFDSHFGEYEDDSVFIRNEIRKCDYEILADSRTYASLS